MAAADETAKAQEFLQTNKGAHIHKTAALIQPVSVSVGGKCIVSTDVTLDASDAPVTLGRRVFIGKGTHISGSAEPKLPAEIGDDSYIGEDCTIQGCTLGQGVVVQDGCTVGAGCRLKDKAIVQAGSRVPPFTSVGPGVTVGGDPARPVKYTIP